MRLRRPAIALAVAVVALALGGCTPADPVADPGRLVIVMPALEGRFADVADDLRDLAESARYEVEVHGTDGDIPAQVTTVAQALDEHVAALVVWPIDATSLTPVIDGASDDTIVVSMGTLVRDTARLDAHAGFDAYGAGLTQATLLLEGLGLVDEQGAPVADGPTGPFRIELVVGSVDDERTEPSYDGAMSVLAPYLASGVLVVGSGEYALADVMTLRGNGDAAASRLTRVIRDSYAGEVPDAVLATSDELARSVSAALLEAGALRGEAFPVVTGRGCELRSLAALLDGRQHSSLLEDPRYLASAAMAFLLAERGVDGGGTVVTAGVTVANGAGDIPAMLVTGEPVRQTDIDEVVVGSGYWSRQRLDEAVAEYGLPTEPVATASPTP